MTLRTSIALCTYNGARFLAQQLASLSEQSVRPYEIVVCDDGSTDSTARIVCEFQSYTGVTVRLFRNKERLGYTRNFLKAASLCTGDLIAFCDQDDIWRADKIERVSAGFFDPNVIMVHHNARLVNTEGQPFDVINSAGTFSARSAPLSQNPWDFSLGFTQTFRRGLKNLSDLREKFLGDREAEWTAHDRWIFFISACIGDTVYIDEHLVDYRQHGNNTYGLKYTGSHGNPFFYLRDKLEGFCDYRINAKVCSDRAMLLSAIADDHSLSDRARQSALRGSGLYESLSKAYLQRSLLYSAPGLVSRLGLFIEFVRSGNYRAGGDFNFKPSSAIRDLYQGVLKGALIDATAKTRDYSVRLTPNIHPTADGTVSSLSVKSTH